MDYTTLSNLQNHIEFAASGGAAAGTDTKFIFFWEITEQSELYNWTKITWEAWLVTRDLATVPRAYEITFSNIDIWTEDSEGYVKELVGQLQYNQQKRYEFGLEQFTRKLDASTTTFNHSPSGVFDFTLHIKANTSIFKIQNVINSDTTTIGTNSTWETTAKFEVPDIPPKTVITDATNFTENGNPQIGYHNSTHLDGKTIEKVEACISVTGATDDVPYRDIPFFADKRTPTQKIYTFNLSQEEREALYPAVATGTSGTVRFYVRTTFKDGTRQWSYLDKKFTITSDYEPTLSPTVEDINPITVALTGGGNRLIRYASNVYFDTGAQARKGASIGSQRVKNGSQNMEIESTGVIEGVDSPIFEFYLADSRGINAEPAVITKEMWEYVKLTCNQEVSLALVDEAGAKAQLTISGNYYNGSFGATNNELTLQVKHTQRDGTMSDWITLTEGLIPEFDGHTYSMSITITGLDSKSGYDFQCRAIDKLSSAETGVYTARLTTVFDWSENDFVFNVPVKFNSSVEFADGSSAADTNADYVIEIGEEEMGSNGIWYWRKWNSGKAEAWGCRNFGNAAVTTAWGNLYRSAIFTQDLPKDVFIRTPDAININIVHSNFGGWICKHEQTAPSADTTGSFIFVRPASATVSPTNIGFYVIGEWQ